MQTLLASILCLLLAISLLAPNTMGQARTISVLPQPAIQSVLAQWLAPATGYILKPTVREDADNTISLKLDASLARLGNEGYLLDVTPQRVTIRRHMRAESSMACRL